MDVPEEVRKKASPTREDGVFTLQLDEGVSLSDLCSYAEDMSGRCSREYRSVAGRGGGAGRIDSPIAVSSRRIDYGENKRRSG
jgi:hypothetical protein